MDAFVIHFRVRMERTFILVFPNIHIIFMINRRTRFENQVFKSLLYLFLIVFTHKAYFIFHIIEEIKKKKKLGDLEI